MAQTGLPPLLNIIALATFAASLSARALDPVLPHVASDFGVSIATAAGFASVFAFTFAIIQPVLGAAADLFGKARLVIMCLVLLGFANVLGGVRDAHSGGHRRRRRVSDLARADQRAGGTGKAPGCDRAHARGVHD